MGRPHLLTSLLLVGLVACAEGSSLTDAPGSGGASLSGSGGAGGTGDGGADVSTSSRASSAVAGPGSSSSITSTGSGEGGAGEGGAGEGGAGTTTGATTSSTGSGTVCDFASPNACTDAEGLGAIAGDEDGPAITVQGTTSKWFQIRVEERASGVSETDLSYSVSLSSPAGMNYDLIVHEGPQDGGVNCGAAPKQGQANGAAEVVSASWDDDQGFGGEDDSLWLSIEVRHVSGALCDLDDRWTLSIQGYP